MWKRGQRIHFECRVPSRNALVLTHGYLDLRDASSDASPAPATANVVSGWRVRFTLTVAGLEIELIISFFWSLNLPLRPTPSSLR